MRRKLLASIMSIGLVAALIGGATMAWFTDDAAVAPATFTAGTVVVNADAKENFIQVPEGKSFNNVNPGDCALVTWDITNAGTKAVELRVKLAELWTATADETLPGFGQELSLENVFYVPVPGSGWTMYEENGEVWLYYTAGPVRGTFNYNDEANPLEPVTVQLPLIVGFAGALTDNNYQGATFQLGGTINDGDQVVFESKVEAIQASNDAPKTVWGVTPAEVLAATPQGTAAAYYDYFLEGPGSKMPCWINNQSQPEPETFTVSASDNIEGLGNVAPASAVVNKDASVILTAQAVDGYNFLGWFLNGSDTAASTELSYTIPAVTADITALAKYEQVAAPAQYNLTYQIGRYSNSNHWQTGSYGSVSFNPGGGSYTEGTEVQITITDTSMQRDFWYLQASTNGTDWSTVSTTRDGWSNTYRADYTMPAQDVQLRAVFWP
jgi:predicted ribosomally synthesized peptide with SipW-like signal peptide